MPFTVIQAPTDITGPLFIIDPQQIATLSDGDYVLVYDATVGGTHIDILSVVFDAQGQLVGSADTTQSQIETMPVATALAGGGYALAWQGFQAGPSDLFTAVFNAQGQQTSVPADVSNGAGNGAVAFPVLTSLSTGGYAATWQNGDIFTAIYDAQGQPVVGPIDVSNTPADTGDNIADVAALPNGNFALAWTNATDGSVLTAVYSAQGLPVAPAAIVTNAGASLQADVRIAALSNGDYALTWDGAIGVTEEIFTAVYDGQGQQVVAPIDVGSGFEPQIAALSNGNYALVWTSVGVGGVFTAVYNAQGQPLSAPVTVSTGGGQDNATKVVALSNGDYALTWYGDTGGGFTDVFTAVYSAQGQQLVAPIDVTNSPNIIDFNSTTTALANGSYVISWQSTAGDGFTDISTAIYQFVDTNFTPGDVSVIGSPDIAIDLSALVNVGGSVTVADNGAAVSINLSNLASVGGNFVLSGNGAVLTITLPNLTTVTGSATIDNNTSATVFDLGSLSTVTGSVDISNDNSANVISLGSLTSVTGSVSLDNDSSATVFDLGSLSTVTGSVDISNDNSANVISLGSLTSVTGSVSLDNDSSATVLDLGSLSTVTGSVDISNDNSANVVSLGSLTSVTGSVSINNNPSLTAINLPSLVNTGSVNLSDDSSATVISLDSVSSVTGSVNISNDSSASVISLGSLTSVTGSADISGNTTVITIDLGALIQAGAIIISNNGVITLDLSALVNVGGNVEITNNDSLLTIDMPNLTDVSGDVTINSGADATLDASAFGHGGGTVALIGDNLTTTVNLGSLDHMQGTLTITSADGVMLTAKAGLADINITGTASDNTLIGSTTTANTMDGGAGNDTLTGGNADDTITGGAGNDTIDGKGGTDTSVYSGNRSDYIVVQNADGSLTIADSRANSPDGTDTVRDIELFKFADGTVTLADILPPPVITLDGQISVTAATEHLALVGSTTVATFTDSNLSDLASGLTASIGWGDGTTSAGTISGSSGSFAVSGGHTYADEGSEAVSVTVTRTVDHTSTTATGTVTVGENDALTPQGLTITANPSQSFTGTVASFTDTDTFTTAGDLTATIDWGDGTTSAGIVSGSAGAFAVSGTHTYASSGQDAVTVTLNDDAPGTATATANSIAVVGATLAATVALTAATEHVALAGNTMVATFTDSNLSDLASGLTATIDWGDGTTSAGTISGSSGSFAVSGGHTYADEGSEAVSVTVTRTVDHTSTTATGTVTVGENDALTPHALTVTANSGQAFTGTVASFTDTDTFTTAGDLTATIDWGDGTTSAGIVSGSAGAFAVSGTHTYASSGQDAVTVTLSDDAPGTATATANSIAVVGATIQTGGNGKQVLDGSAGNQALNGGNGADVLIGGPNDILTGGNGPDTFVFDPGLGRNTITDFNPHNDLIQFDHHVFATVQDILSHVSSDGHGNTLITADANDVVTLLGVAPSSLHAADFHIV